MLIMFIKFQLHSPMALVKIVTDDRSFSCASSSEYLVELIRNEENKMAAATASRASTATSTLQNLVCRSISSFRGAISPSTRIAALDLSPSHISLAISDRDQKEAYPFGVLCRAKSADTDARILTSAFKFAAERDEQGSLDVTGLIVGVSPQIESEQIISYTATLLDAKTVEGDLVDLFPGLKAVLFYSEPHALVHAIKQQEDYVQAIGLLPDKLETRRFQRFSMAMNPKVKQEDLVYDRDTKARISSNEILQAVLDQFHKS